MSSSMPSPEPQRNRDKSTLVSDSDGATRDHAAAGHDEDEGDAVPRPRRRRATHTAVLNVAEENEGDGGGSGGGSWPLIYLVLHGDYEGPYRGLVRVRFGPARDSDATVDTTTWRQRCSQRLWATSDKPGRPDALYPSGGRASRRGEFIAEQEGQEATALPGQDGQGAMAALPEQRGGRSPGAVAAITTRQRMEAYNRASRRALPGLHVDRLGDAKQAIVGHDSGAGRYAWRLDKAELAELVAVAVYAVLMGHSVCFVWAMLVPG